MTEEAQPEESQPQEPLHKEPQPREPAAEAPNPAEPIRPEAVFHDNARQVFLDFIAFRLSEGRVPYRGQWLELDERKARVEADRRAARRREREVLALIAFIAFIGVALIGLATLLAY